MYPLYKCRSDPQIAVDEIFTIASREFRIFGSGTSSTLSLFVPYQQFAFIGNLLFGLIVNFTSARIEIEARLRFPASPALCNQTFSRCSFFCPRIDLWSSRQFRSP